MSEWKLVPVDPVADQSDELARDIIMWWSMSPPTGAALYLHLTRLGRDIPAWLPTMVRDAVYVPPKGVVAMAVYRAMLDAAPDAPQAEPVFYVHLDGIRAMPPDIFAAWAPTAKQTAHEYRPVFDNPPSAELARLRAENERLNGALQEIAATPAKPSNHDLVAVVMLAQWALQDDAPTAPPAR